MGKLTELQRVEHNCYRHANLQSNICTTHFLTAKTFAFRHIIVVDNQVVLGCFIIVMGMLQVQGYSKACRAIMHVSGETLA